MNWKVKVNEDETIITSLEDLRTLLKSLPDGTDYSITMDAPMVASVSGNDTVPVIMTGRIMNKK